jgi:hypothetical protein
MNSCQGSGRCDAAIRKKYAGAQLRSERTQILVDQRTSVLGKNIGHVPSTLLVTGEEGRQPPVMQLVQECSP